ncbi:hypothetical protein [Saccharopolyspora spinosa]|uniref:hypothetical protein n=1 Tax=Saccharopolyspora spinosa TaxID=60894 RepID=UPI000C6F1CD5
MQVTGSVARSAAAARLVGSVARLVGSVAGRPVGRLGRRSPGRSARSGEGFSAGFSVLVRCRFSGFFPCR